MWSQLKHQALSLPFTSAQDRGLATGRTYKWAVLA